MSPSEGPKPADGPRGFRLLGDPARNKSTAFTAEERERFGLRGLLPPRAHTMDSQMGRVLGNLRRKESDIERYIFLMSLQSRNERLFYRTVIDHIEEILPLIYTPTVGQACREFALIFRRTRGFYVTPEDRGEIRRILDNWPERDVRVVVVTDGERILGLGDLGANGMGIPIGKLALYTACAGIHPHQCLPIMLDVGTGNQELREQPLYLGRQEPRLTGDAYDSLVEELIVALHDAFPRALIQFEDFLTPNAFRLLARYRDRVACFNDDIQGTAGVALAGLYASTRLSGLDLRDLQILFLGAGSAATGIGGLMVRALEREGLDPAEARRRLWFVDSRGLVVAGRDDLAEHKVPFAHQHPRTDLKGAIESLRPQVLIGATGQAGAFDEPTLRRLAEIHDRPTVFALSNPTSKAECTAEQAYRWTQGRAIFASGSPFPPVEYQGRTFHSGQGNNAYVFPGLGLGAVVSETARITDDMFLVAARTLADLVREEDLALGRLYPALTQLREVSLRVAVATAAEAYESGWARAPRPADLEAAVAAYMYDPRY